jgi:PAS domain S-box-containing protein
LAKDPQNIKSSLPVTKAFSVDRPQFKAGSAKAYLVAGGIIAGVSLLEALLRPWSAVYPFAPSYLAVILITLLCGSAAGLFAALLSILSVWLLLIPLGPPGFSVTRTEFFVAGAAGVIVISSILRSASGKQRRLNESLRLSEEKFRGLLESAPDAMIIADEEHRIVLVNARTEALFGYAREELLGGPVELLLPEARRAHASALNAPFPLQGRCKDGRELPIEISLGRLETETGLLFSLALRDVTLRRQIEASLAEASKAKSDFIARVSHELRTPLNAIIGFSELIRDAVIAPIDARYREYGADINGAGRHLLNIINDILDISKIEDGRLELREEIISIVENVEACRRIVAVMAEAAGVALVIDMPDALPLVQADQIRLRQILLNVMSNAVKFTPAGGRVEVSAAVETEGIAIAVRDTGIGMTPDEVAIAFEPFRQIDGALSRRYNGTGLGLPLAKALAELHGGALSIQSIPGAGTEVSIRLPLTRIAIAAE